ncbi:MAG: hypothetical protein WC394_00200 [Candidatus Omnitrophota bacterium]|jgi:hypothetical protein
MHPWAIFVEGLKNWRVNWRKLAGIYLLVYIPFTLIDLFWISKGAKLALVQLASSLVRWALDAFVMASLILSVREQLNAIAHKAMDTMKTAIKYLWRYMLTVLLFSLITLGIILLAAIIMSFISAAFVRMPSINLAVLLAGAIVIIACVGAAVYCAFRFSLAGIICIMEEAGPVRSLKISHDLVKKSISPVVGVFCFILLPFSLLFIPALLFNLVIGLQGAGEILLIIYQVLASAVAVPMWVSVMLVLYKKLKEAVS